MTDRSAVADPAARTAVTGQYLPALNGLRAVAVSGVVAYHLGFGWASGGYLGVDLFFVLSGFLITSLLLEEWVLRRRINLLDFWARRMRRLLPALFCVLVAIAIFVVLDGRFGPPGTAATIDLSGLRGDALATLFYVANWHAIFAHQSYFAQFSAPSPLQHTWSLAIEEQFYLVWPPVLLLLLGAARRSWRQVGLAVAIAVALASAALMAVLFHPGADPTRVYYGTDTRVFDLMLGAAVAFLAAARPQPGERARRALHLASPLAGAALLVFWVRSGTASGLPRDFMYRGGFLLCAVLAATVVADARLLEQGWLARLLSVRPLPYLGRISYGVYLWHWPIIVYLTAARTGLSQPGLDLARIGLTLVLSIASYTLVEMPIRRRRTRGWWRFSLAPITAVAVASILVVSTIPAVATPPSTAGSSVAIAVKHGTAGVPGAGGFGAQHPIRLPSGLATKAHPLRVMLVGDSVMFVAELGLNAALEGTHAVVTVDNGIPGFGLSTDPGWRVSLAHLIATEKPNLIIGTWGWDDSCTSLPQGQHEPCALQEPAAYTREIEEAVRLMLHPGDGVSGVVFAQYPLLGPDMEAPQGQMQSVDATRSEGQRAWQDIVASLPAVFPGRVMYLPAGAAVLWHGKFSPWLPPVGDPSAPKSQWVRVRMVDNVHMCPSGVTRYSDALLADLTVLFRLPAAEAGWSTQSWVHDARFNDPPGSCPDDHPS